MDLQQAAERALEMQLSSIESDLKFKQTRANYVPTATEATKTIQTTPYLQGSFVALDPRNGYIRALVGGRDWNHSNFNRATQAKRQPGSAFKPFVYTAAMDNGFRPTDIIVDEPVSFPGGDGKLYQPGNYDRTYRGPVTLRYALQMSINVPAIKLLRKVGTSLVASYARAHGHQEPARAEPLPGARHQRGVAARAGLGVRRARQPRHPQRSAVHPQGGGPERERAREERSAPERSPLRGDGGRHDLDAAERDGPGHWALPRARVGS